MTMEQVAWTAIGLLSTALLAMFGMFFYLGSKIDAQGSRLDGRIDALGARLEGRIDAVGNRLDALGDRMDGLSSQLAAHIIERHSG
ncbi:MAG: hypothetical protein GEU71_17340 [Actinobacteria bacterium]|nr:hypothetical protein [Actinomycetota bacterium]